MKKLISLFITTLIILSAFSVGIFSYDDITVYVDNEQITFPYAPEIVNGYTMVPMRAIFEAFGAEIKFHDLSDYIIPKKKVEIYYGYGHYALYIGDNNIYDCANFSEKPFPEQMAVAPYIKNSTTYVPLRAISTLLKGNVSWDEGARTVNITTPYPKYLDRSGDKFNNKAFSDTFTDEVLGEGSISVEITPDNKARISIKNLRICTVKVGFSGSTNLVNYTNFDIMPYVKPSSTGSYTIDEEARIKIGNGWEKYSPPTSLDFEVPISGTEKAIGRNPRSYTGTVYDFSVSVKILTGRNSTIPITCRRGLQYSEDQGYYIARETPSFLWELNKEKLDRWDNPVGWLKTSFDPNLKALSDEICKDATDDYDKIRKIYTWIAQNIAYNHDNSYQYTGYRVVQERNGVCTGFSSLFNELTLCQNIPCKKMFAYTKGGRTTSWSEKDFSGIANHIFNRAYIDNRWVNIDVTWGTNSTIRNGVAHYSDRVDYTYFDFSDWEMSFSHML